MMQEAKGEGRLGIQVELLVWSEAGAATSPRWRAQRPRGFIQLAGSMTAVLAGARNSNPRRAGDCCRSLGK